MILTFVRRVRYMGNLDSWFLGNAKKGIVISIVKDVVLVLYYQKSDFTDPWGTKKLSLRVNSH